MSHYTVLIRGTVTAVSDIPAVIEQMLEQYSENTLVEPYRVYTEPERIARAVSAAKDSERFTGTLPSEDMPIAEQKEKTIELLDWFVYGGHKYDAEKDLYYYTTDSNPDGEWDWYQIGGRWSGVLSTILKDDFDPNKVGAGESGTFKNEVGVDMAMGDQISVAKAISEEFVTHSALTEGEGWCERATMGWFAMESDETETHEDWSNNFAARFLMELKPDEFIAVVDCHI